MDEFSFYLQLANTICWAFLFLIWQTENWLNIVLKLTWLTLFILDFVGLIKIVLVLK